MKRWWEKEQNSQFFRLTIKPFGNLVYRNSSYKFILCSISWFFLFYSNFYAQQILRFTHISLDQGLSNTTVTTILEDNQGFIWFGTKDGLNKFNGYDFQVFTPDIKNQTGLSHNIITAIAQAEDCNFWVGTEYGLNYFNCKTEEIISVYQDKSQLNSLPDNHITSLVIDRKNQVFVGTISGLAVIYEIPDENESQNRYKIKTIPFSEVNKSAGITVLLYEEKKDRLWVGTKNGLICYAISDTTLIEQSIRLSDYFITSLCKDKSDQLFAGTLNNGLFILKDSSFIGIKSIPAKKITALVSDSLHSIWIGTEGVGLIHYNNLTRKSISYKTKIGKNSLSDNTILSLWQSKSGILWVGTRYGGINKIVSAYNNFIHYKHEIETKNSLSGNIVSAIYVDYNNYVWIGTTGSGLNKQIPNKSIFTHYFTHSIFENITSITGTRYNPDLWLGTDQHGIIRFNPYSRYRKHFQHQNNESTLSSNHIQALITINNSYILSAYSKPDQSSGLDLINIKTNKIIRLSNDSLLKEIFNKNILALYTDKAGIVWIGTEGNGLLKLLIKNTSFTTLENFGNITQYSSDLTKQNTLSNNHINCIYEDRNGNLWIGTGGGGLNSFDRTKEVFTHYTVEDGMANNIVQAILEDINGKLWISTGNGLSQFNPKTEEFRNFDKLDGLQDNAFNLGVASKSKNGFMYFGGINGLTVFHPDSVKINYTVPKIIISKFLYGGKQGMIDAIKNNLVPTADKHLLLSHNQNDLYFEFAALDYTVPEKNQYKYKLEGYNKNWIVPPSSRRFVSYTNLPAGHYTFRVIGSNNDGEWNNIGTSISVTIKPPIYRRFWFKFLILIIVIGIIAYIIFRIIKQLSEEKKLLERQAKESLLDERQQLRTLIDNLPDNIYIKDKEGKFLVVNKTLAKHLGYSTTELIGKSDFDLYSEREARKYFEDEQKIMLSKTAMINAEDEKTYPDGSHIFLLTTKCPIVNDNGEVIGIVGIGRDITEIKKAENELKKKTKELQETNVLLEERQEEIQQQSEELMVQAEHLRKANSELEKLNRTKDKFFSIIAHDLKNPFHAIIGFSELLRKDFHEMDDQQKIGLMELINISSESAYSLLENLLQWARTQTDKIKFKPENMDIHDVIKSNINFHKVSAEKKQIKLTSNLQSSLYVFADKNMINTVVRNLISNAIKFTKNKGEIKVQIVETTQNVEIQIIDNGMGINKENLEKLFRIDTYYSTQGTSGESGTGLGLIICKEFIEKNGGKIKVESEINKGSTFSFTLPKERKNKA